MIDSILRYTLEGEFGSKLLDCDQITGGSVNQSFRVVFQDGQQYFLKFNNRRRQEFFLAEQRGLSELRQALAGQSDLKVPEVIFCPEQTNCLRGFLVLEWLDALPGTPQQAGQLGRGLAQLHSQKFEHFGHTVNNFIGGSVQRNSLSDNWAEFFLRMRLDWQISLARRAGWLSDLSEKLYAQRREEIQNLLASIDITPCLVHGDLWSGNILYTRQGVYLIDPAAYYGHAEVDIAFSEMFGGFSDQFYRTYHDHIEPGPGYESRKEIYNFYHLLNHANLFGGSYMSAVTSFLSKKIE